MKSIFDRVRPNILIAMILIGTLGVTISYMGYRMTNEGIISAAGVGAIMALSNLSGKILEKE
tara:strand:- start:346 stop:531 length:186 start_codon:yes stop_codon:yes gene_type:complete